MATNEQNEMGGNTEMEQTNNAEMAIVRGWDFLAAMPSLLESISMGIERAMSARSMAGNADMGDIHSDTVDAIAEWLGLCNDLAAAKAMAANNPGRIGQTIRRSFQRYAKRRDREIPTAIGAESEAMPADDDGEMVQPSDDRERTYDGTVLTYIAPALSPILPRNDKPRKPLADDVYGEWFSLAMLEPWQAEMVRTYCTMDDVQQGAREMGLMVPMDRTQVQGSIRKDKDGDPVILENGSPAYRHPLPATLYGAQRRAESYSIGHVNDPEQQLAIAQARSLGGLVPLMSHMPSSGDPTYGLAKSAPSAESAFFGQLSRWADEKAGSTTLYGERGMDVARFYVPLTRYRRKVKLNDGTVRPRGSEKRARHIRWADRKGQRGLVSTVGIPRQTIANRLRKVSTDFRSARASHLREWLSTGIVPAPFTLLPADWHAPMVLPIPHWDFPSYGPNPSYVMGQPADSKWTGDVPHASLEAAIERDAKAALLNEKAAAWQQRQAEIREAWLLEVAADPEAWKLERAGWRAFFSRHLAELTI